MGSFGDFFRGKTVLVTGHTGFKGSWLVLWLHRLGAKVVGYGLNGPSQPSHFAAGRITEYVNDVRGDVLDFEHLKKTFEEHQPEIVFHLAAQPIVRLSYRQPRLTFGVNVMGTVNTLEAARLTDSVGAVVVVTSDKCYRNVGWEWPYRESDPLGGNDAYGTSKACAELVAGVYQDPGFQKGAQPPREFAVASARAGNVIGGGDWAPDRLVPDTIRAIVAGQDIVLRNPDATRPWQHVLESLSGYLWLGAMISQDCQRFCSAWNFGPDEPRMLTVAEVVSRILEKWSAPKTKLVVQRDPQAPEAKALRIDSSKAAYNLKWRPAWNTDQALDATVAWYKNFYASDDPDVCAFSLRQIETYTNSAKQQGLQWAVG